MLIDPPLPGWRTSANASRAAARAGRDAHIKLIAVSKTVSAEACAAVSLGRLGENRVQEAQGSAPRRRTSRSSGIDRTSSIQQGEEGGRGVRLHSLIDSPDLVRKIDAGASAAGRRVTLLAQVDLASETTVGAREDELLPISAWRLSASRSRCGADAHSARRRPAGRRAVMVSEARHVRDRLAPPVWTAQLAELDGDEPRLRGGH